MTTTTNSGLSEIAQVNFLPFEDIERLFLQLTSSYSEEDQLLKAYYYANRYHHGQMRDESDQPYIIHPLRMAYKLMYFYKEQDIDTLQAALVHDLVEDTEIGYEDIDLDFSPEVVVYTKMLTRERIENETPEQKHASKISKMNQLLNAELPVKKIKVIDLIDNMEDWPHFPEGSKTLDKMPRWLKQANEVDKPLVASLGDEWLAPMVEILEYMENLGYKPQAGEYKA